MLAEPGNQRGGKLTLEAFLDNKRNRRSLLDRKAIDDKSGTDFNGIICADC